jgi:methylated-DNA-protein-cysteine methyltransferase-like protein
MTDKKADPKYRERVYQIVRRIPRGRVMTYGQIAYKLGEGYTPRTVGFVMHGADESNTPWHRVINSQGRCSTGRLVPACRQATATAGARRRKIRPVGPLRFGSIYLEPCAQNQREV